MKKIVEPILHLLFWLLIFYITYANFGIRVKIVKLNGNFMSSKEYSDVFFFAAIVFIALKCILFYGNTHYFLPKYFSKAYKQNGILKLGLFFLVTLAISVGINYFITTHFKTFESKKIYGLFTYSMVMHFLILFIAIAYRLSKDWVYNQTTIHLLKQEKLQTELDFLKSQINPHFMFNTLNNLYAEARKHKDKTVANGIAKLSHIMRYMIYDSNVEFVDLQKEIQYLDSYIELQKLRISNQDPFDFKFEKHQINPSAKIAPVLFIPFVENAFKYGISIDQPSFIHITLTCNDNDAYFEITNSISGHTTLQTHSGVGLKNVKRRLELLYPMKHQLNIDTSDTEFKVSLTLKLR